MRTQEYYSIHGYDRATTTPGKKKNKNKRKTLKKASAKGKEGV
jgi:hypothetical protein